jgi:antibiotic biosynthesis monooxygenase
MRSRYSAHVSGVIVIVAYKPKPGKKSEEVLAIVRRRMPLLRGEGLVTERVPTIVRGRDGTIIEVSEWKSQAAIDAAHKNPNVLGFWNEMFAVCECVPLKTLPEAEEVFAGFAPMEE